MYYKKQPPAPHASSILTVGCQCKQIPYNSKEKTAAVYICGMRNGNDVMSGPATLLCGRSLTWTCWLINHDQVKGEVDQAQERGKKGEMKKRNRKEIGRGDHNEWLPTVTLIWLSPQAVSTFLGDSILFFKLGEGRKKLSVYVCLREETETGPESHRALCTLVMRWVVLVARICWMTGQLWVEEQMRNGLTAERVILSWGACDGAFTAAVIMRHTLQSNAKHHTEGNAPGI